MNDAGWRDATQVGYYGLGMDTVYEDRANFRFNEAFGEVEATFHLVPWTVFTGAVTYDAYDTKGGDGDAPSIETEYTPATAPGLGADPSYLRLTAAAGIDLRPTTGIDYRPSAGYARRGGYYGVKYQNWNDVDDAYSFDQVDVDVIQHVPILKETWVLSVHGRLQSVLDDLDVVQYFLLPSVGSGSTLRAYSSRRFRDRNSVLLQAEWRWMSAGSFCMSPSSVTRTSPVASRKPARKAAVCPLREGRRTGRSIGYARWRSASCSAVHVGAPVVDDDDLLAEPRGIEDSPDLAEEGLEIRRLVANGDDHGKGGARPVAHRPPFRGFRLNGHRARTRAKRRAAARSSAVNVPGARRSFQRRYAASSAAFNAGKRIRYAHPPGSRRSAPAGRPAKGEHREPKPVTRLQRQVGQSASEALQELPVVCDVGAKKNSKGYKETWIGYKLHADTNDCGLPASDVLTSASVHDSQVAIPLIKMTSDKIDYCYNVMDAAYDARQIYEVSRSLGHVPLIDKNRRGNEVVPMAPHEAARYNERSAAERFNSRMKEEFGAANVMVRGALKVKLHLMFGVLALFADQVLKLAN